MSDVGDVLVGLCRQPIRDFTIAWLPGAKSPSHQESEIANHTPCSGDV